MELSLLRKADIAMAYNPHPLQKENPNPWFTVRKGKIVEINGRLIKAHKKKKSN
jgi:hypothetical protein